MSATVSAIGAAQSAADQKQPSKRAKKYAWKPNGAAKAEPTKAQSAQPTKSKTAEPTKGSAKQSKPTAQSKQTSKGSAKQTAQSKPTTKAKAEQKEKREYGLDSEKRAELLKAKVINPYRPGSSYWLCVESATALGKNKFHHFKELLAEYLKQADKSALKTFKSKEARNDETGADWKQRIETNFYVTTRTDYGAPCRDLKHEMRHERRDDGRYFGYFALGK